MLPSANQCCQTCDDGPTVQVPGSPGAAGGDGADGADGVSAFTTTTAAFTMPAEGATVAVSVANSSWMAVGQILYVQTAGYMAVSSLPTANSAVLSNPENTGSSAYLVNSAPGTNIPSSSKVCPGGIQGPSGSLSGAAGGDLKGNYPNPKILKGNAKGALIVGDATDSQTFVVGANGLMLHADSGQPLGVIWRAIDLTGVNSTLTGALPLARGGTGQTTQTAAFNALSPVTTRGDLIIRDATNNVRLAIGATGTVLVSNGTDPSWATITASNLSAALARVAPDYLLYREEQVSGTDAGGFTSGAWRTRALSNESVDTGAHGALAASQVTLQPGTYRFKGSAGAYKVDNHKVKLRNITAGTDVALGSNARAAAADDCTTYSTVEGRVTIAVATIFELQHQCTTTKATNGLGLAASFGTEVYATLEFWREAA